MEITCYKCGEKLQVLLPVSLREDCPKCRSDVRSCKNCLHYDPNTYNECREPSAERVVDKVKATACDYFSPGSGGAKKANVDLMAAAEALFKKK